MLFALRIFARSHAESDRGLYELQAEARDLLRWGGRVIFEVVWGFGEVLVCFYEVVTGDTVGG